MYIVLRAPQAQQSCSELLTVAHNCSSVQIFMPMISYPTLLHPVQKAYEVANSSEHIVHATAVPKLQMRLRPDLDEWQQAYFVQLTTVGSPRNIERYIHKAQLIILQQKPGGVLCGQGH